MCRDKWCALRCSRRAKPFSESIIVKITSFYNCTPQAISKAAETGVKNLHGVEQILIKTLWQELVRTKKESVWINYQRRDEILPFRTGINVLCVVLPLTLPLFISIFKASGQTTSFITIPTKG